MEERWNASNRYNGRRISHLSSIRENSMKNSRLVQFLPIISTIVPVKRIIRITNLHFAP